MKITHEDRRSDWYYNSHEKPYTDNPKEIEIEAPQIFPNPNDNNRNFLTTGCYYGSSGRITFSKYSLLEDFIECINHEYMHKIIHKVEGYSASGHYDRVYEILDRVFHASSTSYGLIDPEIWLKLWNEKQMDEDDI